MDIAWILMGVGFFGTSMGLVELVNLLKSGD